MSQEPPAEEILSSEELSEVLADAEGTTAEDIERGAERMEIEPPEEAEVVGWSERDD